MDISSTKQLQIQQERYQLELQSTVLARTKQLEDALQVKSRFLAVMSHGSHFLFQHLPSKEIRTPLTGISGMLDLLSESQVTAEVGLSAFS
jgi:signal transduction histidine kinase